MTFNDPSDSQGTSPRDVPSEVKGGKGKCLSLLGILPCARRALLIVSFVAEPASSERKSTVPVKKKQEPALPVDPELFAQCKNFVNKVEDMFGRIFTDKALAPVEALNLPPEGNIDGEYLTNLEKHWLKRTVPADLVATVTLTNPDEPTQRLDHVFPLDTNPLDTDPDLESIESTDMVSTLLDNINTTDNLSSAFVIPIDLLPKPNLHGLSPEDRKRDPLHQRLVWSFIFAFQHPHGITGDKGKFDARESLGRFAAAIDAHRKKDYPKKQDSPLFRTLCIVWTDKLDTIPVFYGHSAWRSTTKRKPRPDEKEIPRGFRQAAMGDRPLTEEELITDTQHPIEQCAEHLALPFAFRAAEKYLADGKGDTVTIFSLALTYLEGGDLAEIEFCQNCANRAQTLTFGATGIRIEDMAVPLNTQAVRRIYESEETSKLFNPT